MLRFLLVCSMVNSDIEVIVNRGGAEENVQWRY